jgi:hypothetical protein
MTRRASEEIQQRALTAMLTDAFFTWPSAVNIAFAIVMFFLVPHLFLWWQPWFWIIFGVIAEVIYLIATVTDPVAAQQAVSRMLSEKYDPGQIKNESARRRMQKALEYKRNIDAFVAKQSGAMKVNLSGKASEINAWIEMIFQLAKNIDAFEDNKIIEQDRRAVPQELAELKRRLNAETDPDIQAELQKAIQIRQQLLDNLQSIANAVKRTDIKLDNTLAQLSTVYAQMQLLDSSSLDSGRAQRLDTEIQSEIQSLADTVSAMHDVYAYKGYQDALQNLDAEAAQPGDIPGAVQNRTRSGGNS